jgi:hypothetical protein
LNGGPCWLRGTDPHSALNRFDSCCRPGQWGAIAKPAWLASGLELARNGCDNVDLRVPAWNLPVTPPEVRDRYLQDPSCPGRWAGHRRPRSDRTFPRFLSVGMSEATDALRNTRLASATPYSVVDDCARTRLRLATHVAAATVAGLAAT